MEWTDYQSSSYADNGYRVERQESILTPQYDAYNWVVYTPNHVPLGPMHKSRNEAKEAAQDHFDLSSNLF